MLSSYRPRSSSAVNRAWKQRFLTRPGADTVPADYVEGLTSPQQLLSAYYLRRASTTLQKQSHTPQYQHHQTQQWINASANNPSSAAHHSSPHHHMASTAHHSAPPSAHHQQTSWCTQNDPSTQTPTHLRHPHLPATHVRSRVPSHLISRVPPPKQQMNNTRNNQLGRERSQSCSGNSQHVAPPGLHPGHRHFPQPRLLDRRAQTFHAATRGHHHHHQVPPQAPCTSPRELVREETVLGAEIPVLGSQTPIHGRVVSESARERRLESSMTSESSPTPVPCEDTNIAVTDLSDSAQPHQLHSNKSSVDLQPQQDVRRHSDTNKPKGKSQKSHAIYKPKDKGREGKTQKHQPRPNDEQEFWSRSDCVVRVQNIMDDLSGHLVVAQQRYQRFLASFPEFLTALKLIKAGHIQSYRSVQDVKACYSFLQHSQSVGKSVRTDLVAEFLDIIRSIRREINSCSDKMGAAKSHVTKYVIVLDFLAALHSIDALLAPRCDFDSLPSVSEPELQGVLDRKLFSGLVCYLPAVLQAESELSVTLHRIVMALQFESSASLQSDSRSSWPVIGEVNDERRSSEALTQKAVDAYCDTLNQITVGGEEGAREEKDM